MGASKWTPGKALGSLINAPAAGDPFWAGTLLVVAAPLLALAVSLYRPAPAHADTVNVTIKIPATVEPNPCTPGDLVALAGQLHIVIATTADGQGGYHVSETMDEKAAGAGLTTGIKYTASKTDTWDWYAVRRFLR
jgi:hypothetical protein